MACRDFSSLLEPQIRRSKPVNASSGVILESPVKVTKRRNDESLLSPRRSTKLPPYSDLLDPRTLPTPRTSVSPKRDQPKRPAKPRKKKIVGSVSLCNGDGGHSDGAGFGGEDGGGLGDSSPKKCDSSTEKCHGVMDGIDWTITGGDIEELKSKAVPEYWESLLDSPIGAVRVTERLYILKDWHPMGYLMVTSHISD
jgi:hypothetical protein